MATDRPPEPDQYVIRLQGRLPARWAAWFDGMTLTTEGDGTTVLTGPVVDQSALHGLLQRVRDVGLPLISVVHVGTGRSGPSTVGSP
jgi:hypothetical protein